MGLRLRLKETKKKEKRQVLLKKKTSLKRYIVHVLYRGIYIYMYCTEVYTCTVQRYIYTVYKCLIIMYIHVCIEEGYIEGMGYSCMYGVKSEEKSITERQYVIITFIYVYM